MRSHCEGLQLLSLLSSDLPAFLRQDLPLDSKAFDLPHTNKDSSDKEVLLYQFQKWPCLAFIRYPVPIPELTTVNSDWTWIKLSSKLREAERGCFQKRKKKENLRRSSTKKDTRKAKRAFLLQVPCHSLVYGTHSVWMLLLEQLLLEELA